MINIVIPMAGLGSRFTKAGYTIPKPFIGVWGKPMIQVVMDNMRPKEDYQFYIVCQREHALKFNLKALIETFESNFELIEIDGVTEGQICTVLKARDFINNDQPLLTANSDQFLDMNINAFLSSARERDLDGSIMTMEAYKAHYGYVKTNPDGLVTQTVEREAVSNQAGTGVYYFKKGSDLVTFGEAMVAENRRAGGEFYTSPVYNDLVAHGRRIGIYNIGVDGESGMYSLGTPEDLDAFLANPKSKEWIDGQ